MSNLKNKATVTNLTLSMLLGAITPINAQTPIAVQESRLDSLNDLSYQIKVSKSKVELSKSKVELAKLTCLENNGCLVATSDIKKILKPIQINTIKNLNALSISAIINQRVVFKDIEGSFQQGDALGDSGIKIITITPSSVVLGTANNPNNLNKTKTLIMDWIND